MTQDIRLAWRSMSRAPSYVAMIVSSLAIGIAAPVLAFSIVNAAALRPVDGVPDQDALVRIGLTTARGDRWFQGSTFDLYAALHDELQPLAALASFVPVDVAVSVGEGDAQILRGELVSPNYFDVLQVRPAAGRLFTAAAAPADRGVVIAHALWERQFQRTPDVVGRFLLVNGAPQPIIGVAPDRFVGMDSDDRSRIWLPFSLSDLTLRREGHPVTIANAGARGFGFVARLHPGVGPQQVEAAASSVVYRAEDGARDRETTLDLRTRQLMASGAGLAPRGARVTGFWRGGLAPEPLELAAGIAAAMALPFLVLAIACVNAGNLVLARAMRATAIWSLQLALGASRARLVRQPIAEGLLLALLAAAAGLLLTRWGFLAIQPLIPFDPIIDWRVVLFTFAIAAATPLLFSLGPVWSVISRTLRETPGRLAQPQTRSRTRTALLVVQAALSVALLGTGTQWIRTVQDGFGDGIDDGDRILVASFHLEELGVSADVANTYYERVLARIRTLPGAGRAALIAGLPDLNGAVSIEGQTQLWTSLDGVDMPRAALIAYVTANLFETLQIPLVRGRTFTEAEYTGPLRTVIVNEPFARRHLGNNAVGQTIRVRPRDRTARMNPYADGIDVTVIGVVRGATGRRNDSLPTVFAPVPAVHVPTRTMYVPFHDAATLEAALPAVRGAIRSIDSRVPHTIASLDDVAWRRSEPRRFMAVAVAALGGLALVLAAIGLFGAMSYIVELRTREIGVRMAIGATSSIVLRAVLRDAMTIAAAGCLVGAIGAAAVAVVVRSTMYGTSAVDVVAYASATAVLLMTMLLASLVPAGRAARIDPAITLRAER
jgi:predicted permease